MSLNYNKLNIKFIFFGILCILSIYNNKSYATIINSTSSLGQASATITGGNVVDGIFGNPATITEISVGGAAGFLNTSNKTNDPAWGGAVVDGGSSALFAAGFAYSKIPALNSSYNLSASMGKKLDNNFSLGLKGSKIDSVYAFGLGASFNYENILKAGFVSDNLVKFKDTQETMGPEYGFGVSVLLAGILKLEFDPVFTKISDKKGVTTGNLNDSTFTTQKSYRFGTEIKLGEYIKIRGGYGFEGKNVRALGLGGSFIAPKLALSYGYNQKRNKDENSLDKTHGFNVEVLF